MLRPPDSSRGLARTTRRLDHLAAAALLAVLAAACGKSAATDGSPARTGGEPRRPASPSVEVVNQCARGVPVYFGEEPNGTTGSHFTLRGGSTSHLQRGDQGELVVWIVDDKGFGHAHVRVTKRMRRVEIGASCETLHAE